MGVFVAEVRPRWSDMDVFGHVNHANTVTLLEEARIDLLFTEAAVRGVDTMATGVVVVRLVVDYHAPLVANGSAVRVDMSVREMRAASFTLDYSIHSGLSESDTLVTTAETKLVPYNTSTRKPRRLTEHERDFLAGWRSGGNGV